MKTLKALAILLAALPVPAPAQADRFFGAGIDQQCLDAANKAAAFWAQQGLSDALVQKQYQQFLAQCSGTDPVTAAFVGAVNVEFFRLARLVVAGNIQPDLYVGLVRDRERKMRLALKSSTWLSAYVQGDSDGDLVPDSKDLCRGTPDLTRTDNQGCPDRNPLAPQPSAEEMQQVFKKMKLITSPACDAAAFPAISAPLKLGYKVPNYLELYIAVGKVPGQPVDCLVLYEVQVRMSEPLPGIQPIEQMYTVVFRSTENIDFGPSGQTRQVFRISGLNSAGAKFLLQNYTFQYIKVEFRVRAVNGNGLSSGWSGWVSSDTNFGEP